MGKEKKDDKKPKVAKKKFVKPRLYSRGIVTGVTRSVKKLHPNRSIISIEGVKTKQDTKYYIGKKVVFQFGLKNKKKMNKRNPKKYLEGKRAIWGVITRHHGSNGNVQVKFERNLPGFSLGMKCRTYMF